MKMMLRRRAQGKAFIAFFLLTVLCVTVFSSVPAAAVNAKLRPLAAAVEAAKGPGFAGGNSARFTPDGPISNKRISGDFRLIVILVDFTNIKHEMSRDAIHNLVFVKMNNYWRDVSYGQFNVIGDTVGWINIGHDETYYGKDTEAKEPGSDQRRRELIADACRLAEGVDFQNYQDIMVVFAGHGQDSDSKNTNLIWPRAYWAGLDVTCGGKTFDVGGWSSETVKGGGLAFGPFTHEFGHTIGLPDLYNADPDAPDYWETDTDYVGLWSLMGYGNWAGPKNEGSSPVGLESWSRIKLGWLSSLSVPLSTDGFAQPLNQVEDATGPKALKVPANDGSYYLIEAREKVGVDKYLTGSGVLVTRIDESEKSGEGIVRVMDCHPKTKSIKDAACKLNESWSDTSSNIYMKVMGKEKTGYVVAFASKPITTTENAYTAEFSVTGLPSAVSVSVAVDGAEYTAISSGDRLALVFLGLEGSTHTVTVSQYIKTLEDIRYYAAENSIAIAEDGTYTVEYVTQFLLLVETEPPSVRGVSSAWFAAGQAETLGPYEEIVQGGIGTRYLFVKLLVDGLMQGDRSVTLRMGQPHTVRVLYVTQYLLRVASDFGDPKGEGWYTAGDVAAYSVTTPTGFLIQKVFTLWTGDITSSIPQGTLAMTRPYTIEAKWRDDYTQLFIVFVVGTAALIVAVFMTKRRKPQQPAPPDVAIAVSESGTMSVYDDQNEILQP